MAGHHKFTASKKRLFIVSATVLALLLGFGGWRQWAGTIPEVGVRKPKLPSPNAYDFYMKAGAALVPSNPAVDPILDVNEVPKSLWKTRYPMAKKEAWLRQNATTLRLLRQGFKHPSHIPPRPEFPSPYQSFRSMARLLVVESRVRGERGDWKGAAESTLDSIELGHDITQGGVLIDFLVGAAVDAIVRRQLWEVLPHLTAREAITATRRLEAILQTRVSYAEVLENEKLDHQAKLVARMQSGQWDKDIEIYLNVLEYTGAERTIHRWRMLNTPRPVIFNNYANYMDALSAAVKKPYTAQTPLPPTPNDFYNQILTPLFEDARWNYTRTVAANDLVLVSLGLHAYRLEHNRYPRTLNELVPRYLRKIPVDAYGGGEPLRYKPRGAKYSLYSIGPDGVDNNGRAIENTKFPKDKPGRFTVNPDIEGDMAAGLNK